MKTVLIKINVSDENYQEIKEQVAKNFPMYNEEKLEEETQDFFRYVYIEAAQKERLRPAEVTMIRGEEKTPEDKIECCDVNVVIGD